MTLRLALTALFLLPPSALHAESPITITDRAVIFTHTGTDSEDPSNTSGYNFGPSVAALPDGRVMAAWFSSPSEGAVSQRLVQAFSADGGRTWGEPTILQDFEGAADFDPALFVAGKETFLFFSAIHPKLDVYFRRSGDSAKTWTEPVKVDQPNHTTRSNGIQLSTGELLVPLHLRGTKNGGVLKSRDDGKTWTRFGAVVNPDGQGGEPTIAETKSGAIHMILRTKDASSGGPSAVTGAKPGARRRRPASPPPRAPRICFAPATAPSSSPTIPAPIHCASPC